MILLVFYLLTTVTIHCQHVQPEALRRSRQLDLGLQDINNSNDKDQSRSELPPLEAVNNGYLPPVSSSRVSQKVVGAQSQQSLDFKSATSLENELCRPPFDVLFCGSKATVSKTDELGIPKPARDLIPPFSDLEKGSEPTTKRQETTSPAIDYSVFSAVSHSTFSSTTRRPVTVTTTSTTPATVSTSKPVSTSSTFNRAEATNELRSYLPPQSEFSAAAQTSVGVVSPPDQSNDHHHHHDHHDHHHHHHGNICEDPFHAFLCTPLKARKRITGALPNSLRGQSSFVQVQKVLPPSDKEPSSSNTFQNEYLPPKPSPSPSPAPSNVFQNEYLPPRPSPLPSNVIKSTYTPPRTTPRRIVTTTTTTTTTSPKPYFPPRVISEPSISNDRFYLPPLPDNKLPSSSNQINQISTTTSKPTTTTFSTPKIAYHSKPISPVFLPVSTPKPISPVFVPVSTPKPISPVFLPISTPKPIVSVSTPKPVSPVFVPISTPKPIVSVPVYTASSTFIPAASFQYSSSTPNILPVFSTFAPLASNEDRSYLPPKINPQPAASFVSSTRNVFPASTFVPLPTVSTYIPVSQNTIRLSPVPKLVSLPSTTTTTRKPFTTTFKPATQPVSTTARPTFVPQPSNTSGSYLPPQPKFQSASNVISTTVKPFTTSFRPFSTTSPRRPPSTTPRLIEQPSSQDRSYLPPDPNIQPAAAQISSAAVAVPQVKNPFHHGRDLCTDPFHSFLCAAAKPRKRITGALPNGFRPDSSNTNELRVKPAPSFQNENRIRPEKPLETSQSQNVGYNYPKPANPFPAQSITVVSSTAAPTTGYSYPKPDKIFPLPSQQKEIVKPVTTRKPEPTTLRTSEARVVSGYDYPKPEKKFPLPAQQIISTVKPPTTGYSYPKPQKPFPLPTEQKEVKFVSPQTPAPNSSAFIVSQPTNQAVGYSYPKPAQSFNLPERKGYSYPKPEKRLELPTESQSKTLLPQTNSKIDLLRDLGSAEFIPVNKLDKREQPATLLSGLRKFGERLRKREKLISN